MVDRLRNDYPDLFLPVCVVSLKEDKKVFEEHGIETHLYKNNPVGEKHNYGIKQLQGRCSHVLHLGSDNIINNAYVDQIIKYADNDYVWGMGMIFYAAYSMKARYWELSNTNIGGPGKLLSAELLDKVDWHIWDDNLDRNLDGSCYKILDPHIKSKRRFLNKAAGAIIVDIKSEVNIHPFQMFINNGTMLDPEYMYKRLSQVEVEYLQSLN